MYTGQQYDQEMGQCYLRARYYNPVKYYDPSGYNAENYAPKDPDINMSHINEAKEEKEDNCKG